MSICREEPVSSAPESRRSTSPQTVTSPQALTPGMMRSGKWMVRLTFPGGTHTKVVAQSGQTVAQVFERALAKRGLEADMHVLRRGTCAIRERVQEACQRCPSVDDSPNDILYWEQDIADLSSCVAVTVMPAMQMLDNDL